MKLEREISPSLYCAVQDKYEGGLYRDAILAALFYLTERVLSQADAPTAISPSPETLVSLFSGTKPSIQLNSMTTLDQILEQIGFGQMLAGLYQGIKYPRVHITEPFDNEKTANAIIVFVDYLLDRISS